MPSPRKKHRKTKRTVDEATLLAHSIGVPKAQMRKGAFEACDIANHTEGDQRKMVRSGERRTIRRKPKIDELVSRGVLTPDLAKACAWYQSAHEQAYETKVKVGSWEAASPSSDKAFGHWPKGMILEPGQSIFELAREAIPPASRQMFDRVVLHGRPLGKLGITFRTAARKLYERIEPLGCLLTEPY